MFVTIKDKDKTWYTHTSLVEDDKAEKVQHVYDRVSYWSNGATFAAFWLSMEAVNRIHAIKGRILWQRALVVAVPTLLTRFLTPTVYWKIHGNTEVKKLVSGAPVFDQAHEVPELDKMYFFLDDDNNYEPSLWHHGIQKPQKPKHFYTYKP